MKQHLRGKVAAGLLLSFFSIGSTAVSWDSKPVSSERSLETNSHEFTLRHIYHRGTYRDPNLHKRLDVRPGAEFVAVADGEDPEDVPPPRLIARSNTIRIERLSDRRYAKIEEHLDYAGLTGSPRILDTSEWTTDEVPGPNVTDKATVVNLAIMAANAYVPKYGEGEWEDVGLGYNKSASFGWEGDGLRGHVFADEGNKTIIVALKGTSPAVFDGDGTTTRDKLNDNLFFSCCCAQGGQFFWRQVCDCYSSTYTCNSTCLIKSLKQKTRYYTAATELYTNVTEMYPDSEMWIVGHSLGGAVSSLLGLTFGHPVVTFEAPGDDLAARRLGLPIPRHVDPAHPHQRANTGSVHFGHTADPIFMGVCNGATSPCTLGGYAMESQCHTGTQCIYDTVADFGWRVGLGYHRIHDVIDNVIRKYDTVPGCIPDSECVDCFNWKYFDGNGTDSKTSTTMTSTSTTKTRSTTCKTPGWWGCLDPTTTSSVPVITTTYTTTTCLTPGWFGCKKEGTTTITTITTVPTTSATTTSSTHSTSCKTPGFLGCNDPTTTSHVTATKTSTTATTATSCKTPGLFWGCYDATTTSPATTHTITSPPIVPPTSTDTAQTTTSTRKAKNPGKRKCKHPALFGLICLDSYNKHDTALVEQDEWELEL